MKTPEQIIVNVTDKTQWTLTRINFIPTSAVIHLYRGRKGKEVVTLKVFREAGSKYTFVTLDKRCRKEIGYSIMWGWKFWCEGNVYKGGINYQRPQTAREERLSRMLHQNLVENGMLD